MRAHTSTSGPSRPATSDAAGPAPHLVVGADGEDLAAEWYRRHGYTVVARNWRTTFGEIDLIATTRATLVVCEVKTRSSAAYGSPAHAVGWQKQRRLRRLAAAWLAEQGRHPHYTIRFDVVAIAAGDITIYENAF